MTIQSHKLGPGVLTIGAGPLNASSQASKAVVEWEESVESGEIINVLSGEQLSTSDTPSYKAKLSCTFIQDELASSGLIGYSWTNKGDEVAFVFEPNTALDRRVTGTLCVVPINIGGDAGKQNTSDVTFRIIGDPVLGDTP